MHKADITPRPAAPPPAKTEGKQSAEGTARKVAQPSRTRGWTMIIARDTPRQS